MTVSSIQIINFDHNLNSADIVIQNEEKESFIARIHKIDVLLEQLRNGREANASLNYLYLPSSLVVDEINEDSMFDLVHDLLDDGDFFNVFQKI
ncbi:hypothetical protein [Portibacter marinus]|uniref:hypothetical protein n=1 Tax=Portibacter marinus TaxID=2898660 RepID=UPI001F3DC6CE|nr:hypothetical protein [Portibacter marinus]